MWTSPNAANASVMECPTVKADTIFIIRSKLWRRPADRTQLESTASNGAGMPVMACDATILKKILHLQVQNFRIGRCAPGCEAVCG